MNIYYQRISLIDVIAENQLQQNSAASVILFLADLRPADFLFRRLSAWSECRY